MTNVRVWTTEGLPSGMVFGTVDVDVPLLFVSDAEASPSPMAAASLACSASWGTLADTLPRAANGGENVLRAPAPLKASHDKRQPGGAAGRD
jgi:hypothetical protein